MISKKNYIFLTVSILAVLAVLAIIGCSVNFNEHYDKIDNKIRPISYQFRNVSLFSDYQNKINSPETAPGDTVELDVFFPFPKDKISLEDIDWKVCWNIYTDEYGNLAPRGGEKKLNLLKSPTILDAMGGQIIRVKFQIPEDILHKSDAIPEDLNSFSKIYKIDGISKLPGQPKTKAEALAYLETLAKAELSSPFYSCELGPMIDGLSQIFSCMYEIYLDFPTEYKIPRTKIRNTARYHRKIRDMYCLDYDQVYINSNPYLTILDFYQGGRYNNIGDGLDNYTIKFSLNKNKKASVDIGILSYWLVNEFYTLEQAFSDREISKETYGLRIFFSEEIYGKIEVENGNLTNIAVLDGDYIHTYNIIIHHDKLKVGDKGWIWVMVYDECYGVANFPQGRDIVGVEIEFVE